MEKIEVSSVNSFTVDERLCFRSFMYIRKMSGPKIDPWATPANIGDQEDAWPFRTHQYLPVKKLSIRSTCNSYRLNFIKQSFMPDPIRGSRDIQKYASTFKWWVAIE